MGMKDCCVVPQHRYLLINYKDYDIIISMKINKAFKFRIYPDSQQKQLARQFDRLDN